MANFLELNGINVPVHADGADFEPKQLQDSERAEDMSLLEDLRATKGMWGMKMPIQSRANAFAFRQLINGEGHYWPFDNVTTTTRGLYSSRGLGPNAATTATCTAGASWLGAAKCNLPLGQNLDYLMPAGLAGITVMVAANKDGAGFSHKIKDSTGAVWTNGAVAGSFVECTITLATGLVRLATTGAAVSQVYDELVILPYLVPADWPLQMYNFQNPAGTAQQWSQLRQLKLGGDVLPEGGRKIVHGKVGKERVVPATIGGTLQAARVLDVDFSEV